MIQGQISRDLLKGVVTQQFITMRILITHHFLQGGAGICNQSHNSDVFGCVIKILMRCLFSILVETPPVCLLSKISTDSHIYHLKRALHLCQQNR